MLGRGVATNGGLSATRDRASVWTESCLAIFGGGFSSPLSSASLKYWIARLAFLLNLSVDWPGGWGVAPCFSMRRGEQRVPLGGVLLVGVVARGVALEVAFLTGVSLDFVGVAFFAGVLVGVATEGVFFAGVLVGVATEGVFFAGVLVGVAKEGVFFAGVLVGVAIERVFFAVALMGFLVGVTLLGVFLVGVATCFSGEAGFVEVSSTLSIIIFSFLIGC